MSVIVADTLRARVAGAAVTTTKGLNVGGACTATSFVGDGSSITGLANTDFINATQLNVIGVATASSFVGNVTGNASGSSGSCSGNAATATALETARAIGGVSFDGTAAINLPGVNQSGTQNTSGTAGGLSGTPNISVGTIASGAITITNATNAGGTARNIYQSTSAPGSSDGAVGDLWVLYS